MTRTDLQLGIVGTSPGNGHPYSFASIVNGFDAEGFTNSEWAGILEYLKERDPADFGFCGVEVTHAWTQDPSETKRLCTAGQIDHAVRDLENLVDADLDGVLILRDDYEAHRELARPFLDAGTPVFLDKPLTMDADDLAAFKPSLRDGQLMSCSGMRFARSLDEPRSTLDTYGDLQVVRGTVLFDWPRYGVHVLEAILSMIDAQPVAVDSGPAEHASMTIETDAGFPIQIDALGDAPPVFDVDIYGTQKATRHQLSDNFHAFRRTLHHFIQSIRTGEPGVPADETIRVIQTLIAGRRARESGTRVEVSAISG
mgnify:CR=1 FL=1